MSITKILSAGLKHGKVPKMKIKAKLIASFSVIILLNLILATVLYFSFSSVRNNVKDIEEKFTPATNTMSGLRHSLAYVSDARGTLLEGALTYQTTLLNGGTVAEAKAASAPLYNAATTSMNSYTGDLISAYSQFYEIEHFSEEQIAAIKSKVLLYSAAANDFYRLTRYYRNTEWERAEDCLVALNGSIAIAYEGIADIEQMIDDQVAAMNAQTRQKANLALYLIVGLNGAALLVGLGLAFGLAGMIATPLRKLTRAANDIGEGEVDADIPAIKTKDEVHDLANALETMRGAIRFLKQNG